MIQPLRFIPAQLRITLGRAGACDISIIALKDPWTPGPVVASSSSILCSLKKLKDEAAAAEDLHSFASRTGRQEARLICKSLAQQTAAAKVWEVGYVPSCGAQDERVELIIKALRRAGVRVAYQS